jgi:hypothetical protein
MAERMTSGMARDTASDLPCPRSIPGSIAPMLGERAKMAAVDPSRGGCKGAGLVCRETSL